VSWKLDTSLAVFICCRAGIRDVSCPALQKPFLAISFPLVVCLTFVLDDVQKRFSVFYLIGCVASALSGILAFGLMQLNGQHGLSGWRWIFILEGVVCDDEPSGND
jgi:hypothetical protein